MRFSTSPTTKRCWGIRWWAAAGRDLCENLVAAAPARTVPLFYRSAAGAEIDLLLEMPGHGLWAIDIKRGLSALPEKGFHLACDDVKPAKRFVVNAGTERYTISRGLEAMGLAEAAAIVLAL